MENSKRVTIRQVAKEAGVSIQTVSRVINNKPDVSPETRQRVQEVITRLRYFPSDLARSLFQEYSHTLGIITAGLRFTGPSHTLNGITRQAEELGYSLLLKELPDFDTHDVEPFLKSLFTRHVDGIIWAVSEINNNFENIPGWISELDIPIVFLNIQPRPNISIVSDDNFSGGKMATQHLLDIGRRHIAHISGPLDWWESQQRKDGWEHILSQSNIHVNENQWFEGDWSSKSGEQAFRHLLQSYPQMDGLFVANDQMALGVLLLAHRLGIKVPQDMAIVGFDGIPESAYFWPPLTTMYQDHYQLGSLAVAELVGIITDIRQGHPPILKLSTLEPKLLIRETTQIL